MDRQVSTRKSTGRRVARGLADLKLAERGLPYLRGAGRAGRRVSQPDRSRAATRHLWLDARWQKQRRRPCDAQLGIRGAEAGTREVIALDRRRGGDGGLLAPLIVDRDFACAAPNRRLGLRPQVRQIAQVLGCAWQRCSVHFLREALGHSRKDQQGMLAALLRPIFNAESGQHARGLVSDALERLRKPLP